MRSFSEQAHRFEASPSILGSGDDPGVGLKKTDAGCVDAARAFWPFQGGQCHDGYGRIGKTHRVTGMNYVYILRCADDTLYCGWTTELQARLAAHNSGRRAKYTRSRRPVELIYVEQYEDRHDALNREWHIKRMNRVQCRNPRFDPWVRKIPWRRKWQPTPVFLPGKSMDKGTWWATVHGLPKSPHNLATKPPRREKMSIRESNTH